nr:tyrosine kinase {catalytic domain, clone Xltk25, subdomain VIII} [Xenopus laevis, Peptide Partial, 25 aa] [Xenopus laevis]
LKWMAPEEGEVVQHQIIYDVWAFGV